MPDLEGGEHVVVYRAVADFRELLAAVAKAKAELKALSSDTTGKAGAAGATERLKRDLDTYTRARVEGSKQAAVAEALVAASHKQSADAAKAEAEATQKVAQAEKELAAASERTAKVKKPRRTKAEIDAEKALIQAEKELEEARARAEEAAARHTTNTKELSNARSALTRAQKASTDIEDAEKLRAALAKVADVQERITRAINARDASKPDLAAARSAQRQAEEAAQQLQQVAEQARLAAEARRNAKAAVTPQPQQQETAQPAAKPVLRRGKIPTAEQAQTLSDDELQQGIGQYSARSKTGQVLRSEATRRTGGDTDAAQSALDKATARTASAEQKLATAKDKVAAQEDLLADAKRQYLQARGDAERIRTEVQNAATRSGVTLTPEQLAGNKHVRAADDALQAAQQPVKDSHANLEAARELRAAAEAAVARAREAEAATRNAPAGDEDDALPAAFQHLLEQITQTYQERHRPSPELSQGQVRDLGSGRPVTDARTEDALVARLRELNSSVGKEVELRAKEVEVRAQEVRTDRGVAKVPVRDPISAATHGGGGTAWSEYDRRHGTMGGRSYTDDAAEALHSYMGAGYYEFNDFKRSGGARPHNPYADPDFADEDFAHLKKSVKAIEDLFDSEGGKLKDDVDVFRGYTRSARTTKPYQIGQVLHDPAYQSTSFDEGIARSFGGVGHVLNDDQVSHLLQISANKGQEGLHLDNANERELLLRRGQYQITGAQMGKAAGVPYRSYQARYLSDDEFADLNKRQTQATNLRAFSSFQAQGQLLAGQPQLERSVEEGLTNLRNEIDASGKELELFRRPVQQAGVETSAVSTAMHHFQDGLDRVNQSLAVQRASYDDISAKTKFFADRLDHVTAVTDEEFQATRRFREGLDQVDRTLRAQAEQRLRQPALESGQAVGARNLQTFAQSIYAEMAQRPREAIASGPTGATASYWESLDRNVRHVNEALERHSVDRFNTGLDKVIEDMRQNLLTNFRGGLEELHASLVGTREEFGRFDKAVEDLDFRLQSNYRARPPVVPRQTDQDILRRQPTPGGNDGGGVVAMRRDDLQRFLDEVKKVYEPPAEPNFAEYEGPRAQQGRQQRPADEGREHRRFQTEGELYDDRPPYEPFRPQIGNVAHDTLRADSTYPGSHRGVYDPFSAPRTSTPGQARDYLGKPLELTATPAPQPSRRRGPFLSQSSFDTTRAARQRRTDNKRRREGDRSFGNLGRAVGDVFSAGGRERSPQLKDRVQDVADVAPRLGEQFNYWTKVILAVTTAVVALIPAIATVTAAFGTLLAAAGGAAAAVGIFALAAYANFGKLKSAIDEAAKSGRPLAQQYQTVGAAFARLQSVYEAFQRATQGPVLAVFTDALNLATRLLPRFIPVVSAAGKAIQGALGQLDVATQTNTFTRFLEFISTYGVTAIGVFTKAALSLGQGLAELAIAFGPYISYFTNGLASLANGFERFAASRSGSGAFKDFMQYAQENAPKVGAALAGLVNAVIHLGAALAPIGGALLTVISYLAAFFNAIPTGAVTYLIAGFVGMWVAIRLLLGVVAVTKFITGLRDALVSLGVISKIAKAIEFFGISTKNAAGEVNTFKVAALGLAGSLGIIGLITILTVGLGKLTAAQDAAAESTKRHSDAVQHLAEQLRGSGGVYTSDIKSQASDDLVNKQDVTVGEGGRYDFFGIGDKTIQSSVADVAQRAGVPLRQAAAGLSGDQKAQDDTKKALADYAKEQQKKLDDFNGGAGGQAPDSKQKRQLEENAAAAAAASKKYNELAVSASEVAKVNSQYAQTQQNVTEATTGTVIPLTSVNNLLKQLVSVTTDSQTAIQGAISAYDAYNQAVKDAQRAQEAMAKASLDSARSVEDAQQRIANATQAVIEAQQSEKESQENLTKAREDAAAQLEDYRRTLRDIPLDEEQASINLQKAIDDERKARNAPGATGLDLRQAKLDRERAQNTYNDTLTDDVRKTTDANRGLTKTVDTSDNVIDATNALKDATTALGSANQELTRAQQDLPFVQQAAKEAIQDAQTAFATATQKVQETGTALQNAATAAGITSSALADVKAKQQALEKDVTLNLSLNDKNNTVDQLQKAAIALQALKLLAADPTLSIDSAYKEAADIVAANTQTAANNRANAGFGGKGQSQGSAGKATGGAIEGPGTATSDSILTPLSTGEHVWTAAEVVAVGGHTMVKAIREAALRRKTGAASPDQYEMAAGLLRAAKVPGRTGGYDPVQLSSAMFTAGLNVAAATGPSMAPVSASTRPVVINNTVHHHGVSTGDITINNPVREQAGGSLYRTLRRMRRDYD